MQVWLATVARSGDLAPSTLAWIARNADAFLPFAGAVAHRDAWASRNGRTAVHTWDNGQDVVGSDIAVGADGSAVTAAGYVHDRGRLCSHPSLSTILHATDDAPTVVGNLGGMFCLLHVSATGDVTAWSGRGRTQSVFFAVGPDVIAISSRPHVAHLVARRSRRSEYDDRFAAELLACSVTAPQALPFVGVRQVADGSRLESTADGDVVEIVEEGRPSTAGAGTVDAAARALVDAAGVLNDLDVDLRASVTGGKDSRLTVALLHEAGVSFRTFTSGRPDHPDVVWGRRVAASVGVEHETVVGAQQADPSTVVIGDRILASLRGSDAMVPAYDAPNAQVFAPAGGEISLGGSGGEVLRGGMARAMEDDRAVLNRKLTWEMSVNATLLTAPAAERAAEGVAAWLGRNDDLSAPNTLAWYHRDVRLGRWNMGRTLQRFGQLTVQPFLDNQAVRTAMDLPIEERLTERAFHSILQQVNPALAAMPLATSTWRFADDHTAPAHTDPVYNWRLDLSGHIGRALFDHIDASPSQDRIFSLIDHDAFERLRADCEAGKNDGRQRRALFLWALAG
ncbi:MAG: asparagine synthase-related protein, partial [Actinomycetota bacterium]